MTPFSLGGAGTHQQQQQRRSMISRVFNPLFKGRLGSTKLNDCVCVCVGRVADQWGMQLNGEKKPKDSIFLEPLHLVCVCLGVYVVVLLLLHF